MYVAEFTQQIDSYDHDTLLQHDITLSPWWIMPFVIFLLMIATGPLFYARFWHRYYAYISIGVASIVVLYYLFGIHRNGQVIHAAAEYVQFISLLTALYFASAGIRITIDMASRPRVNVLFLLLGGVMANIIGTTGASMLLIRPFILLNQGRIRPYHVVFFIFVVSNVGGALTPVGDPPLFLGFLKGVPFFWTLKHNFVPWCFAMVVILGIFYVIDTRSVVNQKVEQPSVRRRTDKLHIQGSRNFFWLLLVVGVVFLDPNIFDWVPAITYRNHEISFLRELVMLSAAYMSYRLASRKILTANQFSFFPIKEVALVFVGIFGTMMPALELVNQFAASDFGRRLFNPSTLYWSTGLLSGFLDNAPTYLSFFTAAMACCPGGSIADSTQVLQYANEIGKYANTGSIAYLQAIALSAVFFGAMTYIGNGPNFMVRSIAQQQGVDMPYFFAYMLRYSIPILLPVYVLVWLLFVL